MIPWRSVLSKGRLWRHASQRLRSSPGSLFSLMLFVVIRVPSMLSPRNWSAHRAEIERRRELVGSSRPTVIFTLVCDTVELVERSVYQRFDRVGDLVFLFGPLSALTTGASLWLFAVLPLPAAAGVGLLLFVAVVGFAVLCWSAAVVPLPASDGVFLRAIRELGGVGSFNAEVFSTAASPLRTGLAGGFDVALSQFLEDRCCTSTERQVFDKLVADGFAGTVADAFTASRSLAR